MKTEENNHALQNAKSWASSISEMVRALDRDTAAEDFCASHSLPALRQAVYGEDGSPEIEMEEQEVRDRAAELLSDETIEIDGFGFDEEAARERIQDSPLSVQVRSGWESPGAELTPSEFEVLLSTGGPALRIRGELDEHNQPDRAWLEYQGWGTPWTQYFDVDQDTLLAFCREFYFGE